jgi:hypothetical protein
VSNTPNALSALAFGSLTIGKVSPSFAASCLPGSLSSTEIAASPRSRLVSSPKLLCSSPSCLRQCGHQSPR